MLWFLCIAAGAQTTHFGLLAPVAQQAGVPFTLGIVALDGTNTVVTNYTGTVSLQITNVYTDPPQYTFSPANLGMLNVPVTLRTPGPQTLTAIALAQGFSGSTQVTVLPTHLVLVAPANVTAGVPFNVTVNALDQNNQPLTAFSDVIGFTTADAAAALPPPTLVNGSGSFSIAAGAAGTQTLYATVIASNFTIYGLEQYNVNHAAATHFRITSLPMAVSGQAFAFQIAALDALNNPDSGYAGTVHFSSSDGAANLPADTALAAGQGSFSAMLLTAGNQALTATDIGNGAIAGSTILAVPGSVSHLAVGVPPHAYPGAPVHLNVQALDAFNHPVPGYAGTVHFTSTDLAAVLPADYTFAPADKGVHYFPLGATLKKGGMQTITATDSAGPFTGSGPVKVGPKAGCFLAPLDLMEGTHPFAVTTGDFNLDSKPDIAIANNQGSDPQPGAVLVIAGNGSQAFPAAQSFSAGFDLFGIVAGDLNGDGKPDLATTDFGVPWEPKTVNVLLGNGDGSFQPSADYRVAGVPAAIAIADLNHDGVADLVTADWAQFGADILLGNGDGTFQSTTVVNMANSTYNNTYGIAVGDLNGDGIPDLVAANLIGQSAGAIGIAMGNGDGTFAPATYLQDGGNGPFQVLLADLNGDGRLDIVAANIYDASVSVLLGNGDGTFQAPLRIFDSCCGAYNIFLADVNNDGQLDLVSAANNLGNSSVRYGNGDGTFQAAQPLPLFIEDVSVADFDGDGTQDIAGVYGTASLQLLFNQNCAGPATHLAVAAPATVSSGSAFDLMVNALDQFELVDNHYVGTVHFTSTDPRAVLPPDYTFVSNDKGAHTFASGGRLFTFGPQTVTATDVADPSISGVSGAIGVGAAVTSVTLTSSANPAHFRQLVTLTATVGSPGGTPAGTVMFMDGAKMLGNVLLSGGVATLQTVLGEIGPHALAASFSGSANFLGSSSPTLVVNRTPQPR